MRGIGGRRVAIGTATVQIPFYRLFILIDVIFHILDDPVASPLAMRYMLENDLDISIQDKVVKHKGGTHQFHF